MPKAVAQWNLLEIFLQLDEILCYKFLMGGVNLFQVIDLTKNFWMDQGNQYHNIVNVSFVFCSFNVSTLVHNK